MDSRNFGYKNQNFEVQPDEITFSEQPRSQTEHRGHEILEMEHVPDSTNTEQAAVLVKGAYKKYGSKSGGTTVLENFNMNVRKGTIYGLLGASGCGKTTLLSCVVGLKRLDRGEILIHGAPTGTPASGVPGKRVGFMPQEVALYGELTIKEAIQYFGRMYGMSLRKIQKKIDFLVQFLNLPPHSRKICTLSGGQKRRVSFAVTLVHDPEIFILDEPTIGVDPLLRQSIWRFLCELVSNGRTTVIITTHYIEEARQADTIGIMRSGVLLAEDSPLNLMKRHKCSLLEDIVLKLSAKYENQLNHASNRYENVSFGKTNNGHSFRNKNYELSDVVSISYHQWKDQVVHEEPPTSPTYSMSSTSRPIKRKSESMRNKKSIDWTQTGRFTDRMTALTIKNIIMLFRNIGFLLFIFILPAAEVAVVCTAIGLDPQQIKMGVINNEVPDPANCTIQDGCPIENLSCRYLKELPTDSVVQVLMESEEAAIEEVKKGRLWGYIAFPEGYSEYTFERTLSGSSLLDNDTIYGSRFQVRLDMSNKQVGQTMKRIFLDAFKSFGTNLLTDCGIDPTGRDSPLYFGEPIYGTDDTSFREFVAPSIAVGCIYFFTLCGCGLVYIIEKREGMLDRSLVAGVKTMEIMLSHLFTQFFVLLSQIAVVYIILFPIFGISINGSVFWVMVLLILVGCSGMSLGFMVSTVCNEEKHAILLAMASFFPNFVLAGMLWPIEAMPKALQYFAYFLPCTLAGESLRSLLTRGWDISHQFVWPGFASTVGFIILYWSITAVIHIKFRR